MPLKKPWETLDPSRLKELSGSMGVYELGDGEGRVIYIGYAGGKSRFGLRGNIAGHFAPDEPNPVLRAAAAFFRYEVNSMYYSRWVDLLSRYVEDHGRLPAGNEAADEHIPTLGRFHWKSEDAPTA